MSPSPQKKSWGEASQLPSQANRNIFSCLTGAAFPEVRGTSSERTASSIRGAFRCRLLQKKNRGGEASQVNFIKKTTRRPRRENAANFYLLPVFTQQGKKVGRRASASSHRYQKFSCVLTPERNEHYPAAARSASCSSRIVGLPS